MEQEQNKSRWLIDNREFVVTWMSSKTVESVAKALGITVKQVSARGSYLRKLGVKLPRMRPPMKNNQLLVAQLNSLIKKHAKRN